MLWFSRPLLCAAVLIAFATPAEAQEIDEPIRTAPPEYVAESVTELPPSEEPEAIQTIDPARLAVPWTRPRERTCESMRTFGLQRGRRFLHQVDVAPGKLVSENTYAYGCEQFGGRSSAEFGASMLVSGRDDFGERGPVDELWFNIEHDRTVDTLLGRIHVTGFITYRAISARRTMMLSDDYSVLGVRVGYPLRFAGTDIELYYLNEKLNPMNNANSLNEHGAGVLVCRMLLGAWACVDSALMRDENSTGATPHKQAWFVDPSASWTLPYGLMFTVGVRYSQYDKQDASYARCIERDAKVVLCRAGERNPEPLPQFDPFVVLSHRVRF